MKVLHLLSTNKYSGAENVVCQIIKLFGNDDMVYCSPNGPIKETLSMMNIKYLPINELSFKNVKKAIEEFKPDVIHAHDLRASAIASRFKKIKKISQIHMDNPGMKKFGLRVVLANLIFKKFDKIIWVSPYCLENYYYKEKVRNKSFVIPNIISIADVEDRLKKSNVNEKFDLVYCGRLSEPKNPLRLLDIARLLANKKKDLTFAIVGDGEFMEQMNQKTKQLNLQNNVRFFGFLQNPFGVIKNSKVAIMTSIFEGTPMIALESLTLGVPIVSTKTDGMKNLIKEGRYESFITFRNL